MKRMMLVILMGGVMVASAGATTPMNKFFNAHYGTTQKMCQFYNTLVNAGWTDGNIYTQLKDGGAFRNYPGSSGHVMFYSLIRWCYAH